MIAIPIGPVPIVLQNMVIMLTGLLLGKKWGVASVFIYLISGAVGLPVFAGGIGGIAKFVGPTGGYLIGYLFAVFIIGLISEIGKNKIVFDIIALICGSFIVYLFGVVWLKFATNMTFVKALSVGMFPFLIGDAIKIAACIPIIKAIRPIIYK